MLLPTFYRIIIVMLQCMRMHIKYEALSCKPLAHMQAITVYQCHCAIVSYALDLQIIATRMHNAIARYYIIYTAHDMT